MALGALNRTAEKQTWLYNQSTFEESMKAGDVVWYANKLQRKGVTPKFQPQWRGPCLFTKMHNEVLAQIQLSSRKSITVHTDVLKPCPVGYEISRNEWLIIESALEAHEIDQRDNLDTCSE